MHRWLQAIPGMVYSAETKTWRLAEGCAAVDSLPPVSFVMGGTPFTLGPRQYMIQVGKEHHTHACRIPPRLLLWFCCSPCLWRTTHEGR